MGNQPNRIAVMSTALSSGARQAAALARVAGFAGVIFDAYAPALSIPDLSQSGRREFRHVLQDQQIELVGLHGDIGASGFGPGADVDRLIHQIDRAMEAAAGLGAPLLCLEIGPLAEPPRAIEPKTTITPEQAGLILVPARDATPAETPASQTPVDAALLASVSSAVAEIARRADRYSVVIALGSSLASFAALEQAIGSARCPWFGVDLDPVAALGDEWEDDEIFSRLSSLIRHVRVRDALLGTDRRTKPAVVGQGNVPWPSLLAHLDAAGYHGWLTVDPNELPDRPRAASAALAHLRSL
jgi:sugar phosphate isomerase/epimerase